MGLREIRKARGLTVEAVGVLGGIDAATVSRIERGLVEPRAETIVKLARGLGMSAKRLETLLRQPPAEASA